MDWHRVFHCLDRAFRRRTGRFAVVTGRIAASIRHFAVAFRVSALRGALRKVQRASRRCKRPFRVCGARFSAVKALFSVVTSHFADIISHFACAIRISLPQSALHCCIWVFRPCLPTRRRRDFALPGRRSRCRSPTPRCGCAPTQWYVAAARASVGSERIVLNEAGVRRGC